jgi:peptidoglycan/LPS O-acetylase OafA/YrhL
MALLFTWVVDGARAGFGGDWGAFLSMRGVSYMGKISYGLYVYHGFAAPLSVYIPGAVRRLMPEPWPLMALSFAMAALSWHLMEQPLLRLKRYLSPEDRASIHAGTRVGHKTGLTAAA